MKSYITIVFSLFIGFLANAQDHSDHENHTQVSGKVVFSYNGETTPLPNIHVHWQEMSSMHTVTDQDGNFTLNFHDGLYHIIAEKEGFETQTFTYEEGKPIIIELEFEKEEDGSELSAIEVKSRIESLKLDTESAMLQFNISDDELLKAACCNLSESFETNPAVDVSYNDAVTGTKEIILLGLNQRYTGYSKDNIRDLGGLATYDGLEFIPGRWVQSIQLAKGTPSVATSFDAITGMINTNFYQYEKDEITKLNFYINQNARAETNVVSVQKLNDKWSNSTFLHGSSRFEKVDTNDDGFLDSPVGHQLNLANVIRYSDISSSGWESRLGFQLMTLEKTGGQTNYHSQNDRLTNNAYGVENNTNRVTVWNKIGKVLNSKGRSFGFTQQYVYHQQNQTFGINPYDGKEINYQAKFIYEDFFSNTNHKYKLGTDFLYDHFKEEFQYQNYDRIDRNLGFFAEYEYSHLEKLKILLGVRTDIHSLAGTQFSPKLHLKYILNRKTSFRLTAGRAFRTANIFEENQRFWVSQRQVQIIPSNDGKIYGLKPEIAWNYGASISQEFRLFSRKANILLDYFVTDFKDQVIADADFDSQRLLMYNVDGKSLYQSFQALLTTTLATRFDVRLAYKYYDTKIDYINMQRSAPFLAKHRGFLNLEYSTATNDGKNWSFDTTMQWVGKMRLPSTSNNPTEYQRPLQSDAYFLMSGQISRNFSKNLRVYLGAENITGYTQDRPIIEVENPFGQYFDASMIYAPIMPTNFYFGLDLDF